MNSENSWRPVTFQFFVLKKVFDILGLRRKIALDLKKMKKIR